MDNILTLSDVEKYAKKHLPYKINDYIEGGSQNEETVKENRNAFKRIKIRPQVLKDVSERNLTTSILGHKISMPIGISPTGFHRYCNGDGEITTAKACKSLKNVMTISIFSSYSTEEVMNANPDTLCLQNLHLVKKRDIMLQVVQDAEKCNIKTLVITMDQPTPGNHLRNTRNNLDHRCSFNKKLQQITSIYGEDVKDLLFNPLQSWEDFVWLKSITKLPVVAKGILTAEDAKEALKHGADAIWVSNHGGRQLDSTPATIDVLPEIVAAVSGICEVYVDGGFRTGLDVFKGLALGANMVFIGRPVMYGLAYDGADGVQRVFQILKNELDNTMVLSGCKSLSDINNTMITNTSYI